MANITQDVELRIRSTNYSKQTTDKVVDSLKDMTKAQDAQIESAKKGTTSVAQLESGYGKLESAAKALISQGSLIKLFEAQSSTLADLGTKLETARAAQKAYTDSLAPGATRTAAQQVVLKKLAGAVADVEKQYMRAETRVAGTNSRMAEFGITTANLAASQQKIVAGVTAANDALAKQEAAINGVDAAAASRRTSADSIAQRELQVKVDNQFAQAERDIANALQLERQAQIANNATAAEGMRERQVGVDVAFAQAERDAAEAINKKTAALNLQKQALRDAADAAERMSRGSAATARGTLPVTQSNLAGQIRDIQNPADAAMKSVVGIETALGALETRVTRLNGPVKDYKAAMQDATRAQAALQAVAGQVDSYNRQVAALRTARQEFTTARTAVNGLVAELRSGAAGDDVTTRLARAQGTLTTAAATMGNLTTATRATRDALNAAGVDTSKLTQAEAALVAQANRATAATNSLTDAFRRNGAAGGAAGSNIFKWFGGEGGRTTLSYVQRLRGELLGLVAGFVGVNAAVALGKGALDAYNINQAITSRLLIANGGDAKAAADDFKYLQEQAERIGFVFSKVAPTYTKFSIATRAAGFSTQETRFAFEQIAGAAVKARLSTEELEGVMKAFEQIASKGTVQAEELRGQLGDRLPGAFQIAAKAAGKTVEEYTKMVSLGEVGSEQVIAIARELGKTYGVATQGATTLLQAQARFENAAFAFKTSTAEGGFVETYTAFLTKLTNLLNGGQGDVLARQLSAGFSAVINVISLVSENIDLLKFAVQALIGVAFLRWLIALPGLFLAVKAEVGMLNAQMTIFQGLLARNQAAASLSLALGASGLTGTMLRLAPAVTAVGTALVFMGRAIPFIGAALLLYQGGKALLDHFDNKVVDNVRKTIAASDKAISDAEKAQTAANEAKGTKEESKARDHAERLKTIAVQAVKDRAVAVKLAADKEIDLKDAGFGNATQTATGASGTADPGERPDAQLKGLKKKLEAEDAKSDKANRAARKKSAKEELADRLLIIDEPFEAMRKNYRESIKDEGEYTKAIELINASSLKAQAAERLKFNNEQHGSGAKEGDKRVQLANEIRLKLKEIEDDIAKRGAEIDVTEPFEKRRLARITDIGHAYDEVRNKILKEKKYAPGQAAADDAKLKKLTEQRKVLEGQNSDRDEANRLVEEFNKKQSIQKSTIDAINAQVDLGLMSQQEANERINEQIADLGPGIQAAGEKAVEFALKAKGMLDPVKFAEIMSVVGSGIAKNDVSAQVAGNNVLSMQRTLNELLEQQQREIDAISLKRSLGAISAEQEVDGINAVTLKYAQAIQFSAAQLKAFVEIARVAGGMSEEQLAKIQAAANRVLTTSESALRASQNLDQVFAGSVLSNGTQAFDDMAMAIGRVVMGQDSMSQGFANAGIAAAQFFAQLMRDLAMAIAKQLILNMIANMSPGSGISSAAVKMGGTLIGAVGKHTGGIVSTAASFKRNVSAAAFIGAPRYHTGGMAGFAPNEVPAILKKNEEVLTRNDPRHILNGGQKSDSGGAGNRFVLVDDRKNVPQAMQSSAGEKVTLVHLKNNLTTLKQWLK